MPEGYKPSTEDWIGREARIKKPLRSEASFFVRAQKKIAAIMLGAALATGGGVYTYDKRARAAAVARFGEEVRDGLPEDFLVKVSKDFGRYETGAGAQVKPRGFEKLGFSNEIVGQIFEKTFPPAWAKNTIKKIEFQDKQLEGRKDYNIGGGTLAACEDMINLGGKPARAISIGEAAKAYRPEYIFNYVLLHEAAHAHDFRYSLVPPEIKREFLYRIVGQLKSELRYKSSYVESINNKDKKLELASKASEYWAEIFAVYLENPGNAKKRLPAADIEIIEDYLKIVAPGFDAQAASLERKEIIHNNLNVEYDQKIESFLKEFMSEDEASEITGFVTEKISEMDEDADKKFKYFMRERRVLDESISKKWKTIGSFLWKKFAQIRMARGYFNAGQKQLAIPILKNILSEQGKIAQELAKLKPRERSEVEEYVRRLEKLYLVDFSDVSAHFNIPPER